MFVRCCMKACGEALSCCFVSKKLTFCRACTSFCLISTSTFWIMSLHNLCIVLHVKSHSRVSDVIF